MSMNIFKTFEIFLREPLSILRDRIIQIVNINSNFAANPSMSAELLDGKTQITIVNNDRMYNLLKTVQYRQKVKAASELRQELEQESSNKEIVIGRLLGRK